MHTELSDTHEAEEMMTQDRAMSNSSLPPSSSESSWESSSESSSESNLESSSDPSSDPVRSSGIREIRVALEIGHGGGDPGAIFKYPKEQERREYEGEYDYWSKHAPAVANYIRSQFESNKDKLSTPKELSVKIFNRGDYTPDGDDHGFKAMIVAVKTWKPDVAVGLHLNFDESEYSVGHLCVSIGTNAEAVKLSERIKKRLTDLPHHQRDDTDGSLMAWCKVTDASVILEAAFVTSPSDVGFLYYMYEEITEAIASGIYDYMVDKGYAGKADSSSSS